jgi:hypothetical protein
MPGMPTYGTPDREYGLRMATCDPGLDGPIYMLNLMKYRDVAVYATGEEAGVSGRDADDRYAPVDVLDAIGAQVCLVADVVDASEDWDRVGVVRYPTRRAFVEMQSRPDFRAKHVHKEAGMDRTIVMGTLPVDGLPPRAAPGRLRLEVWDGEPPTGPASFAVEGTIVGDGRSWTGVGWSTLADGDAAAVPPATPAHQVLVLRPVLERWA